MARSRSWPVFPAAVLLALAASVRADEGWEQVSNEDGITVWRRETSGSDVVGFRGSSLVDLPVRHVANVLLDGKRRKSWVANLVEARVLRRISDVEHIEYTRGWAPWPVKDRDFVLRVKVEHDRALERLVFSSRSIVDPEVPPVADCVRGELVESSVSLTSTCGGAKTLVVVQVQADPKGSIPTWVVNLFQRSWPRETLEAIKREAATPAPDHELVQKLLGVAAVTSR